MSVISIPQVLLLRLPPTRSRTLCAHKRGEEATDASLTLELPDLCPPALSRRAHNPNPCVVSLGLGPDGATCKTCVHLYHKEYSVKSYLKCGLRKVTSGASSDHRAKWDACARYQAIEAQAQTDTPGMTPPASERPLAAPAVSDDDDDDSSLIWWAR